MFHFLKKTSQIADARLKFLKDNNYPRRYRRLIDPKATSDDEADPKGSVKDGQKVFYIKRQQERSAGAEEFIRRLDEVREQSALPERDLLNACAAFPPKTRSLPLFNDCQNTCQLTTSIPHSTIAFSHVFVTASQLSK